MNAPRLILLTDARYDDLALVRGLERATRAHPPGSLALVLRERRPAIEDRLAGEIRAHRGRFVVKGDAFAEPFAGLHVGSQIDAVPSARSTDPDAWISAAAHSDEDVSDAARAGATAVLVSPIFATPGKGAARGVGAIERAVALAGATKVYALGGIERAENAEACVRAGAHGIAVVRAAWEDDGARLAALAEVVVTSR